MSKDDLEKLWTDEKNWNSIGVYRCAFDPRLIVPKRIRLAGWTINIAHRSSYFVLALLMILAAAPIILVVEFSTPTFWKVLGAIAGSLVLVIGVCVYFSSKAEQRTSLL